MLFIEDLRSLRLYPGKRKIYIPIDIKDKRHGSAIFLMGQSLETNEKLMNLPYIYQPGKLFKSYYIDRNVMNYIDASALNEEEEEFDEIKEATLSEGLYHKKESFGFKTPNHG